MNIPRILIGALVALTAATGVFGKKFVWSHLRTASGEIKDSVRGAAPDEHEHKRIQNLIADMSRQVLAYGDKIADIEAKAAALQKDVADLEQIQAGDRSDLLVERNFLAKEGQAFEIRGATYSRTQVESSAQARILRLNRNQMAAETKRKAVEQLRAAVVEGRARLHEAELARDEQTQKLEVLVARLGNARLQSELAELAGPLRDGVVSLKNNELALSMNGYEERIRSLERETEASRGAASEPALIPHQIPAGKAGLLEQMDRLLIPAVQPVGG